MDPCIYPVYTFPMGIICGHSCTIYSWKSQASSPITTHHHIPSHAKHYYITIWPTLSLGLNMKDAVMCIQTQNVTFLPYPITHSVWWATLTEIKHNTIKSFYKIYIIKTQSNNYAAHLIACYYRKYLQDIKTVFFALYILYNYQS